MTTTTGHVSARTWLGLAAILAATFMGQVDGFIVTVAAPSVQRDLPASFGQIQLVGAAYVLACAAGLVTGGRLGDHWGRRRTFLAGIAVFTVASLLCGLAPSPGVLIVLRCVQGLAAAVLVPQELALIHAMFPGRTQRARAIGWYGVVLGLGVIAGLGGGGLLVHWNPADLGWRAVFLVNVPIGLLILLVGRAAVDESRSSERPGADLAGAALTAIALPSLLVPLVLGTEPGASGLLWTLPFVALAAGVLLVRQQRKLAASGGAPLFPPRVLATPGLRTRLAAITTFFAGNSGLFLVFTYYVQTGLGRDPLTASLMFVPLGAAFALGSAWSARLSARFGDRLPVLGCCLLALALLGHLAAVRAPVDAQDFLLAVAIGAVGLAQGIVVAPVVTGIFARVGTDDAGATSGVASTVTQLALATGYSVIGVGYRMLLGAAPGAPAVPLNDHVHAYSVSIVVLAALALVTGALCARSSPL
ncbi:MFS transporter [Lentzea sp. NPDC004782]|uniref:MFS transporter n=1 Tax=Lentzea sp. NPDC004782 TaxID=3154458 RepID=UPI0033AE8DE7